VNPRKQALVAALARTGVTRRLLGLQGRFGPCIRAVNYHDVPQPVAERFESQLRFYREHFLPVGPAELAALLRGEWSAERPGLLLSFDDGLRSHAEVVAPLLERHGFCGWFFVPGGFLDAPAPEQADFAVRHRIGHLPPDPADPRLAMTWEQARGLASRHVVGCHSWNHVRLGEAEGEETLRAEIVGAKARLEERLGRGVDSIAWVGGERWSYSLTGARLIREAGFRLGFMTNHALIRRGTDPLQLQRTNVEASFEASLVEFQLSPVMDLLYARKRAAVNRLTGALAAA
jgi:peptidoglycan/xylan/chitin deacetylase (PgdA/CDA1 family)